MTSLPIATLQGMPAHVLMWGLGILFCGWVAVILHRLVVGRINTDGLLRDEHDEFSPARVQLLVSTLAVLGIYAAKASKFTHGDAIPDLDNTLLGIFGASHGIHLSAKSFGRYFAATDLSRPAGHKGGSHGKHGNR